MIPQKLLDLDCLNLKLSEIYFIIWMFIKLMVLLLLETARNTLLDHKHESQLNQFFMNSLSELSFPSPLPAYTLHWKAGLCLR